MTEKRNAQGQTEAEFLAACDASKFERPSVTVDYILRKQGAFDKTGKPSLHRYLGAPRRICGT